MGEVQRGWLSNPHRKQHVWVPSFWLQDRKGTRVKSNGKTGRGHPPPPPHTHTRTHLTRTPLHASSHKIPNPWYPNHTHPEDPHHTCPGKHWPARSCTPMPAGRELQAGLCSCLHPRPPSTQPTGPEATSVASGMCVCRTRVFFPTALLTTCSSSRLSLESSALCVDSAARTPLPSVTPLSFSPSVGGTWGMTGAQVGTAVSPAEAFALQSAPRAAQGPTCGCAIALWVLLPHSASGVGSPLSSPPPGFS